jgi:pimeloyl-ACP methyl ester carboxylesterase
MSPEPTGEFVIADGVRYHYLSVGEGEPLLLLHGFPENHRSFSLNWGPLADAGYRVIVPDLKGYGQSDKPLPGAPHGDYRMSRVSLEIGALIEALGYERAHVAGHDWGGIILSAMIHRCPERIKKAVLLNAPFRRFVPWKPTHVYYFNLPWLVERRFARDPHDLINGLFQTWSVLPERFSEADISSYIAAFQSDDSFRCAMGYYRGLPRDVAFLARAFASPLPAPGPPPTLIVWGAGDPILPPVVGRMAHKDLPGSRLEIIDGAGHFVQREAAERVNALIVEFLSAPA